MNSRRLILTVGTKRPIAMVGRQIILMMGEIVGPLSRHWFHDNPSRLILAEQLGCGAPGLRLLNREQPSLEELFCADACYCRVVARTCTSCFCGVFLQHIPVPIGCERFVVVLLLLFVVVALTRIEADTMTLRGYNGRKSSPERLLSLQLPCQRPASAKLLSTLSFLLSSFKGNPQEKHRTHAVRRDP
jgi:hypothetical protein